MTTYQNNIHTCHAECQNPACIAVREAVKAEQDRCCRIVTGLCISDNNATEIIKAIRGQ